MSWEQSRALIFKEVAVVSRRSGFWALRGVVVGGLTGALLVLLYAEAGWSIELDKLRALSGRMVLTVCVCSYCAAVFIGPAAIAGAMQEEKERGMLEVLISSPLTMRQILLAIVGGRLALVVQFFAGAAPLLAFPLYAAGADGLAVVSRTILAVLLGTACSTVYAVNLVVSGHGATVVRSRLLLFVVFTPAVGGIMLWFYTTAFLIVLGAIGHAVWDVLPAGFAMAFVQTLVATFFPFWSLGSAVFLGPLDHPTSVLPGVIVCSICLVEFSRAASRGAGAWLRRQFENGPRPERRSAASRRAGRAAGLSREPSVEQQEGVLSAEGSPALRSSREVRMLFGVGRWLYRLTGGNAFVVRAVLEQRHVATPVMAAALCLFCLSIFVLEMFLRADGRTISAPLSFFVVAVAICLEGSRLLPARERTGFRDMLLSTPLSGWAVVRGGLGALTLRLWPFLAAVLLLHLAPAIGAWDAVLASLASLFLLLASWLFISGVVLWTTALFDAAAARVGASLAVLLAAGVAPGLLVSSASFVARIHPLFAWADGSTSRLVATAAIMLALAAPVLGGFALAFDRLTGRS